MTTFKKGDIVKYKCHNDKELRYEITKVWHTGCGYFDIKIIDEDANYDGYFHKEYLSVTHRDLLDDNS